METAVLTNVFQVNWGHFGCYGLVTCQGASWNQSYTMRTSKKQSKMSEKMAPNSPKQSKIFKGRIFKGDSSLDTLFSR